MKIILSTIAFILCGQVMAAPAAAPAEPVKPENFRCEKLLSSNLQDFKASMVENCNLNMPFSTSFTKTLKEESYLYCCHKK